MIATKISSGDSRAMLLVLLTIEMPDQGRASRPLATLPKSLTAVHRSASLRPNNGKSPTQAGGGGSFNSVQLLVIRAIPSDALSIAAGTNESGNITSAIRTSTSSVAATFGRFPKLRASIRWIGASAIATNAPHASTPSSGRAIQKQEKIIAPNTRSPNSLCPKAQ